MAYIVKILDALGTMPVLDKCVCCGKPADGKHFSVSEGGVICGDCVKSFRETTTNEALIYDVNFGIVDILKYFTVNPLKKLEHLALKEDAGRLLQEIIREYAAYYLDASDLKSEKLIQM